MSPLPRRLLALLTLLCAAVPAPAVPATCSIPAHTRPESTRTHTRRVTATQSPRACTQHSTCVTCSACTHSSVHQRTRVPNGAHAKLHVHAYSTHAHNTHMCAGLHEHAWSTRGHTEHSTRGEHTGTNTRHVTPPPHDSCAISLPGAVSPPRPPHRTGGSSVGLWSPPPPVPSHLGTAGGSGSRCAMTAAPSSPAQAEGRSLAISPSLARAGSPRWGSLGAGGCQVGTTAVTQPSPIPHLPAAQHQRGGVAVQGGKRPGPTGLSCRMLPPAPGVRRGSLDPGGPLSRGSWRGPGTRGANGNGPAAPPPPRSPPPPAAHRRGPPKSQPMGINLRARRSRD